MTSRLHTMCSHQIYAATEELSTAFGGDAVAARAANAILRADLAYSLDELKQIAAADGKEDFHYRLTDLRNVGAMSIGRIMAAIYPTEA